MGVARRRTTLPLRSSALHSDTTAHCLGHGTTEVEAQPIPDHSSGEVAWQAHEAVEQQRDLLRWDAEPMVAHHDLDRSVMQTAAKNGMRAASRSATKETSGDREANVFYLRTRLYLHVVVHDHAASYLCVVGVATAERSRSTAISSWASGTVSEMRR